MAVDLLGVYNSALYLAGQRRLSTITEARESRYILDDIVALAAVENCLEIAQPTFARETNMLALSATSGADHGLDQVFDLPSDYISLLGVFADDKLDQPVSRYLLEGRTISCEFSTVYIRFMSSTKATVYADWSPTFARVVSAFLAKELTKRIAPNKYEGIEEEFNNRVAINKDLDLANEPKRRPNAGTVTLSNAWRNIYNDALLIMGVEEIVNTDDDSDRRAKLDRALDADLVESLLEDYYWHFGRTSIKSQFDPSIEPAFGYAKVHAQPADMLVLYGIYSDEYMDAPIRRYKHENGNFFVEATEIYVEYTSTDFLVNPSNWPAYFRKLVASKLAKDAAMSIGGDHVKSKEEYDERLATSRSTDVRGSPPKILTTGNWVADRFRGGDRNRPEQY